MNRAGSEPNSRLEISKVKLDLERGRFKKSLIELIFILKSEIY